MYRGTHRYRCHKCGETFSAPDIELNATAILCHNNFLAQLAVHMRHGHAVIMKILFDNKYKFMSAFDYNCSWCRCSFKKSGIKKVERIGLDTYYSNMFHCLGLSKPNYSIRIFHNFYANHAQRGMKKPCSELMRHGRVKMR